MPPLEIEVKFLLQDATEIRRRLLSIGAESKGRVFESNIRFENGQSTLYDNGCLLRLRKDTVATLTFKSLPPEADSQFKVHRELEVEVSDFEMTRRILTALGFHEKQVYEKWRETLLIGTTVFCLDAMPYGNFLEIEGDRSDIRKYADRLGLEWNDRIIENYLGIFDLLKERMNLPFSDLTFDNFSRFPVDLSDHCEMFRAGGN
jgi:adenylate cyclase, class 2